MAGIVGGVVVALGVTMTTPAPRAHAGIVVISRESRVLTEGQAGATTTFDASDATTQFGTFELGVARDVTAEDGSGIRVRGSAMQRTTLGTLPPGLLHVAGTADAFGSLEGGPGQGDDPARPSRVSAASLMTVVFSVIDRPEAFRLTATFGNNLPQIDSARIFLLDGGGDLVFRVSNLGATTSDAFETGPLAPGQYTLNLEAAAGSSNEGVAQGSEIAFDFVAGEATLIPLPPAVLSGGTALIAAALVARWSKLRGRRA